MKICLASTNKTIMLVVVSIYIMAYIWLYLLTWGLEAGKQKKCNLNITHDYALDSDAVITTLGKQPKHCLPFLVRYFMINIFKVIQYDFFPYKSGGLCLHYQQVQ